MQALPSSIGKPGTGTGATIEQVARERRPVDSSSRERQHFVSETKALIDVLTFCGYLKTPALWPAAAGGTPQQRTTIAAAALALQGKVQALVTGTFQPPPLAAGDPIYTQVWPPCTAVRHLGRRLPTSHGARFARRMRTFDSPKETLVTPPPAGESTECSWTDDAFDRAYSGFSLVYEEETPCLTRRRKAALGGLPEDLFNERP